MKTPEAATRQREIPIAKHPSKKELIQSKGYGEKQTILKGAPVVLEVFKLDSLTVRPKSLKTKERIVAKKTDDPGDDDCWVPVPPPPPSTPDDCGF